MFRESIRFAKSVKDWSNQDPANTIAVHCKGGKGRTGTAISMWLLESGQCKTAEAALKKFGDARTDWVKGSKFQGVETPSQSRFVGYFEKVLTQHGGNPPPRNELKLTKIIIHSINGNSSH